MNVAWGIVTTWPEVGAELGERSRTAEGSPVTRAPGPCTLHPWVKRMASASSLLGSACVVDQRPHPCATV